MPLGVKQEETANPLKARFFRDTLEVKDTVRHRTSHTATGLSCLTGNSRMVGNPYLESR
jgi:hypothetical protein